MKSLFAFIRKEWLETVRSGKLLILTTLFLLFGIMNPAIAKLTPWMMEMMTDSLTDTGIIITEIQVSAFTSWTQFFKNIPVGLIAFVLIYSSMFTKEYQSGTLVLVLTKGLQRYKVVVGKTVLIFGMWTFCYWLCFAVTYGYNSYFWDNSIVEGIFLAAAFWWLFGVWVIALIVLFSAVSRNSTGVLLGVGGTVLVAYLAGIFPQIEKYTPVTLMNASLILANGTGVEFYIKAVAVTAVLAVISIAVSIPIINKKQI